MFNPEREHDKPKLTLSVRLVMYAYGMGCGLGNYEMKETDIVPRT